MNIVILRGNLTKDVQLEHSQSGKAFVNFTLACNNGKDKDGNERAADFIPCKVWGSHAVNLAKWKKKGDELIIIGKWHSFVYEKDDAKVYAHECMVSRVEFVGKKENEEAEVLALDVETPMEELIPYDEISDEYIRF